MLILLLLTTTTITITTTNFGCRKTRSLFILLFPLTPAGERGMETSTEMGRRWSREGKDCTGRARIGGVAEKTGGWHDSKTTFPVLVDRGIFKLNNFSREIITRENYRIIEVETMLHGYE